MAQIKDKGGVNDMTNKYLRIEVALIPSLLFASLKCVLQIPKKFIVSILFLDLQHCIPHYLVEIESSSNDEGQEEELD